ncbi:hypothetical protein G6F65_019154 [Rhizopus arrhizus]|nr:hypothetical protein G6F65_019154 [Rhizopus arrhizus]
MWAVFGVFMGNLIGVLPGMGVLAAISILLPLTYTMTPTAALVMLSGIYYGAHLPGRQSAGAQRQGRVRAVHADVLVVLRRVGRHPGDDPVLADAGGRGLQVRPGRIFLHDDAGPAGRREVGDLIGDQRRGNGGRGAAAGRGRHRCQHRHDALSLRHPGALRRFADRGAGHGPVRRGGLPEEHQPHRRRQQDHHRQDQHEVDAARSRRHQAVAGRTGARHGHRRGVRHPAGHGSDHRIVHLLRGGKEGRTRAAPLRTRRH